MNYENSLTTDDIERALIEWAETGDENVTCLLCLSNWSLNENQWEIAKDACANSYAPASPANAIGCIAEGKGLVAIAEVLRVY
jgi:hypothetical protein